MTSITSARVVAATLAIEFDDRRTRRRLALQDPAALERARLALLLHERRASRTSLAPQ